MEEQQKQQKILNNPNFTHPQPSQPQNQLNQSQRQLSNTNAYNNDQQKQKPKQRHEDKDEEGQEAEWESFDSREQQQLNSRSQSSSQYPHSSSQQGQLNSVLQQALNQLQQNLELQQDLQDGQDQQGEPGHISLSQPIPLPAQEEQTLGCEHYLRNCQVEAPCCKLFYTCKLCHDEKYQGPKSKGCKVERMAFNEVKHIKCLVCNKVQEPSLKCVNPECEITFGKYACLKCKLYENKSTKVNQIFHCDQCKMCRRGKRQEFFHCKTCGYCRPNHEKDKHKCSENLAESACPICLDILKYSTKAYIALSCGHLIHIECFSSYTGINCPVCGMALRKLSENKNRHIEKMIEQTRENMPKELADKKVNILCNQCLHKTIDVTFHYFGMKCGSCGTFNTKMI